MKLEEFLESLRVAARESGIVKKEEELSLGPTKAKIRFHLEDGSYIDVFMNAALDKRYFHWQKLDGKIYRINNFPPRRLACACGLRGCKETFQGDNTTRIFRGG